MEMKPHLKQFASANKNVKVVKVDLDAKNSAEYKKYKKVIENEIEGIPFTMVLDDKGERLTEFMGMKEDAVRQTFNRAIQRLAAGGNTGE